MGAAIKVLEGRNDEVSEELGAAHGGGSAGAWISRRPRNCAISWRSSRSFRRSKSSPPGADHDADVIAIAAANGEYCVALMFVRAGRSLGSTTFFPKAPLAEMPEVLAAFVMQYYLEREPPAEIIVEQDFDEMQLLESTLTQRAVAQGANLFRGARNSCALAGDDAQQRGAGVEHAAPGARQHRIERSRTLREAFDLEETPSRLECFDISHTGGTDTVASCVVFGLEGPLKSDYRRFNISGIQPGDDYAAMYQALTRRYKRVRDGEAPKPDVLLIDGGKGQLAEAAKVLDELGIAGVTLIGVAKGADRRAGQEQLFLLGQDTPIILAPDSRALHLIQRVRDEAHRFAIAGHRRKRAKRHNQSILETIPGLGPVKRRELLKQFGGLQGILRAGIDDFVQVRGLGRDLAQIIYEHLHPGR